MSSLKSLAQKAPSAQPLPATACPRCHREGVKYSVGSHTAFCPACGWALQIAARDHQRELALDIVRGRSVTSYLQALTFLAGPVAPPPPKVVSTRDGAGVKARVLPEPEETPAATLVRLAGQFELNGGMLRRNADGTFTATSQRRREDTLAPITRYTLTVTPGRVTCDCDHGRHPLCAHRAGLHTRAGLRLADPDSGLTDAARAELVALVALLEAQAGVTPPAPARSVAERIARADAAARELGVA